MIEKKIIFNTEVTLSKNNFQFNHPIKTFHTNLNFVTISSALAKDIKVEKYNFDKAVTVICNYFKDHVINFTIEPGNFQDILWSISKIYVELFKKHLTKDGYNIKGYEFLYLTKVKLYKDNFIELKIEKVIN